MNQRLFHSFYASVFIGICFFALENSLAKAQSSSETGISELTLSAWMEHRFISSTSLINSQFLKDSTLTHIFSEETETWSLSERTIFTYDNLGRNIEKRGSLFHSNEWRLTDRVTFSYGNGIHASDEKHQLWNADAAQWRDSIQRSFSYDSRDRIEEESTHIYKSGIWKPEILKTYAYNSESQLITELDALWNPESNRWKNHRKINFEYDEAQNLSQEVTELWSEQLSEWVNESSKQFEYNDDNMLISSENRTWDKSLMQWVLISSISVEYNEQGQIEVAEQTQHSSSAGPLALDNVLTNYDPFGNADEILQGTWDINEGDWDFFEKDNHYWSTHKTGNLSSTSGDINCIFNNPYSNGLPWFCSSLKEDVTYHLDVYDLLGRSYFQDSFLGQHTFSISSQLPSGVYVVVIQGGLDFHTEKIVVR